MSAVTVLVRQCDSEEIYRADFRVGRSMSKHVPFLYCRKTLGLCLQSVVSEMSHELLIGMPVIGIKC